MFYGTTSATVPRQQANFREVCTAVSLSQSPFAKASSLHSNRLILLQSALQKFPAPTDRNFTSLCTPSFRCWFKSREPKACKRPLFKSWTRTVLWGAIKSHLIFPELACLPLVGITKVPQPHV